jgi:hypothetical protein
MKALLLAFIFLSLSSFAQDKIDLDRNYGIATPEKVKIDISGLREHIYSKIPYSMKKGMYERLCYRFAHASAVRVSDLMNSDKVYNNKSSFEIYLNKILKKIVPPELENDSMICVHIVKESAINNFFMMSSGDIFISMGFFPEAINERVVASEIAHELAHYYLNHSLHYFLEEETGGFEGEWLDHPFHNYSVEKELEADSLAIRWMKRTEYGTEGMMEYLELLKTLDINKLKKTHAWKSDDAPHAFSQERMNRATAFYNRNSNSNNQSYLISEHEFDSLRNDAKREVLNIALKEANYFECIEKAFRFHLFNPNNGEYIYFLMESIRKQCYLFPELWRNYFITNSYYDTVDVNGSLQKSAVKQHLFAKFDFGIIPISLQEAPRLKARFYWKGDPKFTTYEGAFEFYYAVSQQLKLNECILSYALKNFNDKEKRNIYLKEYLSHDSIQHRDFAQSMLDETIFSKLDKKKLLVIDYFQIIIGQRKDKIPFPDVLSGKKEFAQSVLNDIILNSKERSSLLLSSVKENDYRKYEIISELSNFERARTISRNGRIKLFILEPRYWEFFYEQKINEIEFLDCSYYNGYTEDRNLESYKKIINMDCKSLFHLTNSTNYFDYVITGIRQIQGGVPKVTYGRGDIAMNPKDENIEKQIIENIKFGLNEKAKLAANLDYLNREK